jgi:hypothetical protein
MAEETSAEFDIVIPVGSFDIDMLHTQIEYTKRNVIGFRNIYIISYDDSVHIEGCITVSESIFPFSIETVSGIHGPNRRNGWYLQQLLKLYAGFVIPNILDRYLVIDCDTLFTKPTTFIHEGKSLLNYGTEYHIPYFDHMKRLHPSLTRTYESTSGICHHMMLDTKYVRELLNMVESRHSDTFYNVFLKNVVDFYGSGASEYEIYFNFMMTNHYNDVLIRPLNWKNTGNLDDLNKNYHYISYHWHMR